MSIDDDEAFIASAYADLARPTVPAEEPVTAVRRRMRQRRQRRRGVTALATAAVIAVVAVGVHLGNATQPGASASGAGAGAPPPRGALPDATAQGCAMEYDRSTITKADWAADATVTTIGWGRGDVTVVLDVHTWYRGGAGEKLKVRLPSPRGWVEDAPPTYGVDTRLLLSGSGSDGSRLAWTCGFTRYYDDKTAAVWTKVFTR